MIKCSKTALVSSLAPVIAHLSWKIEEVISNGHPGTPKAATLARRAAQEALASQDWQEAGIFLETALRVVKSQKPTWNEEMLRSLFDLFLVRWEYGTVDNALALIDEMIPHITELDTQNGRPPLGKADLLHLKSYMLCVQRKYEDAASTLVECLAIRKKHLPQGSQLVAQNEQTLIRLVYDHFPEKPGHASPAQMLMGLLLRHKLVLGNGDRNPLALDINAAGMQEVLAYFGSAKH